MNGERPTAGNSNGASQGLNSVSLLKKMVLLIDVNSETRESRSKVMRTLGVTVHCASSARSARSKLDSSAYDLILVDLGADNESAEALVEEIREKNPRQLVAFLVGSPMFVATSLDAKRARPSRTLRAPGPVAVPKAGTPGKAFDFGQRVKDAQAKQIA